MTPPSTSGRRGSFTRQRARLSATSTASFNAHLDVNGDGFSDVLVAARFGSTGVMNAGAVSVLHGSGAGLVSLPSFVLSGEAPNENFGRSVSSAGDVNGDGDTDVIVGANRAQTDAGSVLVAYGSRAGLRAGAVWQHRGVELGAQLGVSVASARDVDRDGFAADVGGASAASPGSRANAGLATVHYGNALGDLSVAARSLEGAAPGDAFGHSLAR